MTTPSRWKNFRVWRGQLPHWRADGVTYYVTFRHRRSLDEDERRVLFRALMKADGRDWNLLIVSVLPEQTDLIGTLVSPGGEGADKLTSLVERAKTRAGKEILKVTGERFPPFYGESYDRILRDEAELAMFLDQIARGPVDVGLAESPEEYSTLWMTAVTEAAH
jgi:hypothetical protein